jgi:hypothetical protein
VSCSTTEAEYVSLSESTRDALWLKSMLPELGYEVSTPVIIHEDNQDWIALTKHRSTDKRSKHIDIKYHHIRDHVERGSIQIKYCPTEQIAAEALTKPIPAPKLVMCSRLFGMHDSPAATKGVLEVRRRSKI